MSQRWLVTNSCTEVLLRPVSSSEEKTFSHLEEISWGPRRLFLASVIF